MRSSRPCCLRLHTDGRRLRAKLSLVDLAGSERMGRTGAEAATAREAVHINKSLSFLEQARSAPCIRRSCNPHVRTHREPERLTVRPPSAPGQVVLALSRKSGAGHVPYRSSKLTHYLKDAIGGSCCMRLIACIHADVRALSAHASPNLPRIAAAWCSHTWLCLYNQWPRASSSSRCKHHLRASMAALTNVSALRRWRRRRRASAHAALRSAWLPFRWRRAGTTAGLSCMAT